MSFYNKDNGNFGFNLKKINSQESLFHAIYFLDYETGSLLVCNRYSNDPSFLRDDLICSFLNAINLFINELKEGENEELQEINFKDTRILYEREGKLLVIAVTKKNDVRIERGIVREILEDFYLRFKNQINNFNGAINSSIKNYKKRLENLNLNNVFKFNSRI
ncbi:MAG: hypothetical protein KGD65_08865 [Candidatus Lokiarchaeota archaeon]|nr:hypothetical protein [Candidatus Lokiarchaeota archaeon]